MQKRKIKTEPNRYDLDTVAKIVELDRAAHSTSGQYDIAFFLDRLADPVFPVSDTAFKYIMELVPMASLPLRWQNDGPHQFDMIENIPDWIYKQCHGWGDPGDFIDLCIQKLTTLKGGDLDNYLTKLAYFQGCHEELPKRLNHIGQTKLAAFYSERALQVYNKQYPKQICFSPTLICQLNCKYCISAGVLANKENTMSFETAIRLIDWASRNGVKRACLSGGEPTLYPHFSDILHYMKSLGLEILLATNGLGNPETTKAIVDNQLASVTLHLTTEVFRTDYLHAFIGTAAKILKSGIPAALRINLDSLHFDLAPSIQIAKELGINDLRVAIPIPNATQHNYFVDLRHLSEFARQITTCFQLAHENKMNLSLSKPFPLCMLPENVARHFISNGSMISNCQVHMQGYSHNLLINPDLSFSPCLALNSPSRSCILDHNGVVEAAKTYRPRIETLMHKFIFPECNHCPLSANGRCTGTCLSYRMKEPFPC